jgi:7-carboxy-7-deazaguanine synthase
MTLTPRALAQTKPERIAPLSVLDDDGIDRTRTLLVHEIYTSLQGEGTRAGVLCTFVRLTACHLRCTYCDTEHAFDEGTLTSVDDVLAAVQKEGARFVQLTGGEPLLQRAAPLLMRMLSDAGFTVLLETSGGVSTERVDPRVVTILDVKTPGSGEHERNVWKNLERLRAHDEVKFVITSADDYAFAKRVVDEHALPAKCTVLFSPSFPGLAPVTLAEWMVRDRLDVRFQMQLHKVLWGEKRGV